MNKIFIGIFIAALFIPLLFSSCANQKAPTGGPRDSIPPQLVRSDPPNESLNFNGNTIELEFNEFIKLDKIQTQLVITPTLDKEYKVKQVGKRVRLQFDDDDPFLANTTYTFNFQNVVKDLTEGNPWENAKIVFSTGDELDSLFIEGTVYDLLTQEPVKEGIVALYNAQDTLGPLTDKPLYFGKTGENGEYRLENLAPLSFTIYAFTDKNENLIIDPGPDQYAFYPDTINLTESLSGVDLETFGLNINDIILLSERPIRNYFDFTFNKYITDYQLVTLEDSLDLYTNFQDNHEKVRVYNTIDSDSVRTKIIARDSLGNQLSDTVYIKFQESQLPPQPFSASVQPGRNEAVPQLYKGKIGFNKPVMHVNYDSLIFIYDSLKFDQLAPDNISFNKYRDELAINKVLDFPDSLLESQNKTFIFYLGRSSFISAAKDSSQSMTIKYSLLDPVNYGTIKGNVITENESFIIQLLNSKYEPVKEIRNQKSYTFSLAPQGSYMIRVLVDNNNNGQWDPGIITENQMPEQVVYYQSGEEKALTVKANWELTEINIEIPPYYQ